MTKDEQPVCPNESNCPIYKEVDELRSKVATLSTQVRTDYLTGLFNKQHLIFALEQEMERTRRTHHPTTLILIDGDHFKSINDTHGHVIGDKVIGHLSKLIKETVRKIDIPCRYGGEEFAIILPTTSILVGIQVAERIRSKIEESPLYLKPDKHLKITVSLGVDTHYYHMPAQPEELIKLADKKLYQAKSEGRNRVCHGDTDRNEKTTVSAEEKEALFSSEIK